MNELYKKKEWLEKRYISDELSDFQIGKILKVNSETIRHWRKKFNIVSRARGDAVSLVKSNHCVLSPEVLEWINGELLGDGSILPVSKYSAQFWYGSRFPEYVNYVSNMLKSFGIKQTGKIKRVYSKEFDCHWYCYNSLAYSELLLLREKWYPRGKKIAPRDLKLTPMTCRQWYIGDGRLSNPKNYSSSISLCTYGFPVADVKWLVEQLINLSFKATWHKANLIYLSVYSVEDFLSYIGSCPVKCYQYKWKFTHVHSFPHTSHPL